MYLPSLEAIYHDDIPHIVAMPADEPFTEADHAFMMEEEAAELALRSKPRYAKTPRRDAR